MTEYDDTPTSEEFFSGLRSVNTPTNDPLTEHFFSRAKMPTEELKAALLAAFTTASLPEDWLKQLFLQVPTPDMDKAWLLDVLKATFDGSFKRHSVIWVAMRILLTFHKEVEYVRSMLDIPSTGDYDVDSCRSIFRTAAESLLFDIKRYHPYTRKRLSVWVVANLQDPRDLVEVAVTTEDSDIQVAAIKELAGEKHFLLSLKQRLPGGRFRRYDGFKAWTSASAAQVKVWDPRKPILSMYDV